MFQKQRLITLSILLGLVMSVIFALPLTQFYSEDTSTFDAVYAVSEAERPVDAAEFSQGLEEFTARTGIGVALEKVGADIPRGERHLYIVEGSQELDPWFYSPPPSFNPRQEFVIFPYSQLKTAAPGRGYFLLEKGSHSADSAVKQFDEFVQGFGLAGSFGLGDNSRLLNVGITPVILATAFLNFTLGALQVLIARRRNAIGRLLGQSQREIAQGDFLAGWKTIGVGALVTVGATVVGLFFYNQCAEISTYATFTALLWVLLSGSSLLGYVTVQALFHTVPILGAIKGDIPHRYLAFTIYVVRAMVLVLTLTLANAAIASLQMSSRLASEGAYWQQNSGLTAVDIATGSGESDLELAQHLREMDRRGELVLADQMWSMPLVTRPSDQPVVLMNHTAAQLNGLDFLIDDLRIVIAHKPNSHAGSLERARVGIDSEVEIFRDHHGTDIALPEVTHKELPAGAEVFTFATTKMAYSPPSVLSDPVLVVIPPGLLPLSQSNVIAPLSQGKLMIRNEALAAQLAATPAGTAAVGGYQPAINRWLKTHSDVRRQMLVDVVALVLSIVLMTIAVVVVGVIYQMRYRRQLLVRYLVGQPPIRGRVPLVVLEVLFFLAVPVWLVWQAWSVNQVINAGTARAVEIAETVGISASTIAIALAIAGGWALLSAITIAVSHRSMHKEIAS